MSDTDATQARQDVVADVDEILEHTINANMLSMPYDVYFELFDAVAGLGAEIGNLQAENDKLRYDLEEANNQAEEVCIENAKLRELVKEMHVCLEDECKRCHEWGDACDLEHQMRDLGVEVDG